jgi:hypothetical protein
VSSGVSLSQLNSLASSIKASQNINSQNHPRPHLVNKPIICWGSSLHRDGLEQVRHDEHHDDQEQ